MGGSFLDARGQMASVDLSFFLFPLLPDQEKMVQVLGKVHLCVNDNNVLQESNPDHHIHGTSRQS
eukprot:508039-Pelagomonas_calceolata.AAC.8